ncbi:hypothetical protein L2E82_38682 [Cichorium intybus]|uniref:Uncharacterized protein n=1 Tax=Cichorium intybus TaxID=13427 RepID=A0ACB9AH85_CICIN|nr:hypothetical protein L2E82_38682 [Cichorium intybus]
MDDSKSSAVAYEWRNYLQNGNGDIFEILKRAIMVAASDHPTEFQIRRHNIAQTLLSGELIKRFESDKCKKQCPKETKEETLVSEALNTSVLINEEGHEYSKCHGKPPNMLTVKLISGRKFQIPLGPVTTENKVDDHGARVYSEEVAEVLRIKKILDKSEDKSESESVVCDLLAKLQSMGLSMETLEETMIGKTVSVLKKHASEKVRQIARTLVKAWKRTVDEWIKKQSNNVEPTSQHVKPTNLNMNTERKLEGSEKASMTGNGGEMDSSDILEAAKRKLQEGYKNAENIKKKRRVQMMEVHEVMKQGLLPPHDHRSRRKVYWRH